MRDSIGNLTPPDDISIINCRSINNNKPIVINSNNGSALNHFGRGYPSNITIQNFESDRGSLIAYDVDTLHVVNSIFKNTDWILGKTVDFSARNVTIDNCVLTQAVTGIFAEHIDGLFKLSNTVIDSTLSHGLYIGTLSASDKMTIQNNEFYRIGNSGMELRATGNPITVTRNNTIQKTGGNAILCNQGDQSIVHDNTCFGTGNFNVTNGGTVRDNVNIN
jgi:hypothetical protein